jgi:Icc-related predicted phosphoesterase
MRIACVSDIHARPVETPEADLLIVSGDLTYYSSDKELEWFEAWLKGQLAKHKIFIAGNHDKKFQTHPWGSEQYVKRVCADGLTHYLQATSTTIAGLSIWGSPWIPKWGDNTAFGFRSRAAAKAHWAKIPEGVDVLITHGPPFGILDQVSNGKHVGDPDLLEAVKRIKPKLHVFGHIHSGYGKVEIDGTTFVNACICTDDYKPDNKPIVVEL